METSQISQAFLHATAPAFILGAVAGFVAILMGRLNLIIERMEAVAAAATAAAERGIPPTELPRLRRRAKLMNDAIYYAVLSAICTTMLVVLSFGAALFGLQHEPGAALMFVLALGLMTTSLVCFAREVRLAISEYERFVVDHW